VIGANGLRMEEEFEPLSKMGVVETLVVLGRFVRKLDCLARLVVSN